MVNFLQCLQGISFQAAETPSKLFPRLINKMQKDGSPSFPSTAPAKNNKHIRSFHLLLVCTNLLRSSHFWSSSAASFLGPLRTTGLLSFKFMTLVPPGVLRFTTGPFYIFRDPSSAQQPLSQSPALLLLCNRRPNRISIVVHANALHMSVIISGQLLTLLLRGTFLPSISLQFGMSPLTGDPP